VKVIQINFCLDADIVFSPELSMESLFDFALP